MIKYKVSMSVMTEDKNDELGFTLVEVIISIMAVALFIFAFNTIYTTQIYINQRGRDTSVVNSFVETKIESLRSKGFLGLSNGETDISNELPSELGTPRSASLNISEVNSATKKIVINVNYTQQGQDQNISYTSYIGELGVGQY